MRIRDANKGNYKTVFVLRFSHDVVSDWGTDARGIAYRLPKCSHGDGAAIVFAEVSLLEFL